MLDRYAVQKLLRAGVKARDVARQIGTSLRSVRRIGRETLGEAGEAVAVGRPVGRPCVTDATRERVRTCLEEEPTIPPGEVCRRLREHGTPLGSSTTYRVLTAVRGTIPTEVLVGSRASRASLPSSTSGKSVCNSSTGRDAWCTSPPIA
jgi:hypothetical protein